MRYSVRLSSIAVALLATVISGKGEAQDFTPYGPGYNGSGFPRSPPGQTGSLRVQVNVQIQMPAPRDATLEAQKAAIQTAHAALYDLTAHECETVSKTFDGDCRVTGVNLGNNVQNFGPSPMTTFNATVTIEVAPHPSAPPAPPH